MCRTSGPSEGASQVLNYVCNWMYIYEGFAESLAICAEAMDQARLRGAVDTEAELRGVVVWACQAGGDWDRRPRDGRSDGPADRDAGRPGPGGLTAW